MVAVEVVWQHCGTIYIFPSPLYTMENYTVYKPQNKMLVDGARCISKVEANGEATICSIVKNGCDGEDMSEGAFEA